MNRLVKIVLATPVLATVTALMVATAATPHAAPVDGSSSHAAMHDRIDACQEALARHVVLSRASDPVYLGSEGSNKWTVEIEFLAANRLGGQAPGVYTCTGKPDGNFRSKLVG